MAFDSLLSMIVTAVRAKPEVGRANPEGHAKRDHQDSKQRGQSEDRRAQPVPNCQGQITGKLIDTTA